MVQISYKGWRKNEPVDVSPERPLLLRQLLTKEFGSSPYLKASWDLGTAPRFLQQWAPGASTEDAECAQTTAVSANVVPLFRTGTSRKKTAQ